MEKKSFMYNFTVFLILQLKSLKGWVRKANSVGLYDGVNQDQTALPLAGHQLEISLFLNGYLTK